MQIIIYIVFSVIQMAVYTVFRHADDYLYVFSVMQMLIFMAAYALNL